MRHCPADHSQPACLYMHLLSGSTLTRLLAVYLPRDLAPSLGLLEVLAGSSSFAGGHLHTSSTWAILSCISRMPVLKLFCTC